MVTMEIGGGLSSRGALNVGDKNVVWDVMSDVWDEKTNPNGYINLGVAENALMHPEMLEFIHTHFRLTPHALTYGDGPLGTHRLREAYAHFINRKFNPLHPVKSEHVIITNGTSTAIETVAFAVADAGDAILLGQPYYVAFPNDWGLRAHVQTIPVAFGDIDPFGVEAVERYEANFLKAKEKGVKVKALMLCSPHNPLGGCYSKETLIALMKFCQKYRIHFFSDEIYGMSVFHNQETNETGEFISVLSLDTTGIIDPELVHVLWGMSKDFGANGLRIGGVISQNNPNFLQAISVHGLYHFPSLPSDVISSLILSNDEFVDNYIKTNQARMSDQHKFVVDQLQKSRIPYYKHTNAAFFIWMDLLTPYMRKTLKVRTQEDSGLADPLAKLTIDDDERSEVSAQIHQKLLAEKVYVAAGEIFGTEEPGWFRLGFTQPKPLLEEGLKRVVRALGLDE